MAFDTQYLFTLLFRIAVSSYFISCGLNWINGPSHSFNLLSKNLEYYDMTRGFAIDQWVLNIYAHVSVIIGSALLLGWRIGKYLAMISLVINQLLLSESNELIFFSKFEFN